MPALSSVGDHVSTGAFASMNSHFSASSSKRAKRTGPSLSASLPIAHVCVLSCCRLVENSAGAILSWASLEERGERAPAEHVEVAFGAASLFIVVVNESAKPVRVGWGAWSWCAEGSPRLKSQRDARQHSREEGLVGGVKPGDGVLPRPS